MGLTRALQDERVRRFVFDIVVNSVLATHLLPRPLRRELLRRFGFEIGTDACISADCYIGSRLVSFGDRSFANVGCTFDGNSRIVIGKDVQIGMRSLLLTATHQVGDTVRRAGEPRSEPIRIGDGVWIGAGSIILAGVTIGNGALVAAGSVVRQDCEPDTLYAGVPARAIRKLVDPARP